MVAFPIRSQEVFCKRMRCAWEKNIAHTSSIAITVEHSTLLEHRVICVYSILAATVEGMDNTAQAVAFVSDLDRLDSQEWESCPSTIKQDNYLIRMRCGYRKDPRMKRNLECEALFMVVAVGLVEREFEVETDFIKSLLIELHGIGSTVFGRMVEYEVLVCVSATKGIQLINNTSTDD